MTKVATIAKALMNNTKGYDLVTDLYDNGNETAKDLTIKEITTVAKAIDSLALSYAQELNLKDIKAITTKALKLVDDLENAPFGTQPGDEITTEKNEKGETLVYYDGFLEYIK